MAYFMVGGIIFDDRLCPTLRESVPGIWLNYEYNNGW